MEHWELKNRKYVYVIGPDIGPQKIGVAQEPRKRLSAYRTHNVQNVKLHFMQNCPEDKAKAIEMNCHEKLMIFEDHGEWFRVTKENAISTVLRSMFELKQPNYGIEFAGYMSSVRTRGADGEEIPSFCAMRKNKIIRVIYSDTFDHENANPLRHHFRNWEDYIAWCDRFFWNYQMKTGYGPPK